MKQPSLSSIVTISFTLLALHLFGANPLNSIANIAGFPLASEFNYTLDHSWPVKYPEFGGIAGIDIDKRGNIVIFHRGSHEWGESTFDDNGVYQLNRESPISAKTVVTIDPDEMKIVSAWGQDLFFLPHGLSIDLTGENVWLTDVALHQVFKFSLNGSRSLITLGTAFEPGNDDRHFCKPTSVADTGNFIFVADGYCNSRVVMFTASGRYLAEFGQSNEQSTGLSNQPSFSIPHKITYAPEANMLCVADRENGRIQCFSFDPKRIAQGNDLLSLKGAIESKFTIADPKFNGRLFSIDYSPIMGGILAAVSGESFSGMPPQGFVYNVTTGQLISRFAPPKGTVFGMAHDLAIYGDDAGSLYVCDIKPINLWKFSRPVSKNRISKAIQLTKVAGSELNQAVSLIRDKDSYLGFFGYLMMLSVVGVVVLIVTKAKRLGRLDHSRPFAAGLHANGYPASINSLFGSSTPYRRAGGVSTNANGLFAAMFSRGTLYNLFNQRHQLNNFSRVSQEESDNSDDDKSDSDVEEFNINRPVSDVKVNV